jgi:hypothetical protein
MKTNKILWQRLFTALTLLVLCSVMLVNVDTALAGPAAVTCAKNYTVKSGDYLTKIAAEYDVTLTELANANNLTAPFAIYVGQSLCIPKSGSSSSSSSTSTSSSSSDFTATKKDEKLTIEVENFPKNAGFYVRVQPVDGSRSWEKVGSLSTDKYGDGDVIITLTSNQLKKASQLNVCLKNTKDDELTCTVTGGTYTSSSSSSSSSTTGGFSVTVKKEKLTIQVEDFPKNSGYFVRVKPTNSTLSWEKIGSLSTDKYGDGKVTITLDSNSLKKASQLEVCLKNIEDDKLTCTTTGSTSSSSSSSTSTTPLSFTARVQGNQLVIQAKNATEYVGYYVRVNKSANQYTGSWYRIGTVTANEDGKINKAVRLTGDFQKAAVLHVCLKNASTDETFCVTINP